MGDNTAKSTAIRDRIREFRRVPATELIENPANYRRHPKAQLEALSGILEEIGFAGAVLVRETPDGLQLIDGHARRDLMTQYGNAPVPTLVTDLSAAEANTVLATYDPIGAMAEADAEALNALLAQVDTGSAAVTAMLADLAKSAGLYAGEGNDLNDVTAGLPDYAAEDQLGTYHIAVHFDTFEDVQDFGRRMGQSVTEKTRYIWHPYKAPLTTESDYTVDDDES